MKNILHIFRNRTFSKSKMNFKIKNICSDNITGRYPESQSEIIAFLHFNYKSQLAIVSSSFSRNSKIEIDE